MAVIVLMGVGTFSTAAGVNSALYFHSLWERQRVLISSIVSNAPSVPDGTLFIVRNFDRSRDPFGHNMWLDLALRLAYPAVRVGGIYLLDDNRPAPGMNINIANGEPRVLSKGFPIRCPKARLATFLCSTMMLNQAKPNPLAPAR